MENASKALLFAASVLIGIMVLSIGVYLFATFGKTSADINEEIRDNQVAQFNSQFTKYDGRSDVTIHDIITMGNIAKENNYNYDLSRENAGNENTFYINIVKNGNPNTEQFFEEVVDSYANNIGNKLGNEYHYEDEIETLKKYTCNVDISSATGRVYKVTFNENR